MDPSIKKLADQFKVKPDVVIGIIDAATPEPFGPVTVMLLDVDKAYDSRWNPGDRNTKMVECSVPLAACGLVVKAAIYANLTQTKDGHEIEYRASLPKGLKAADNATKDAFLGHVERAAMDWTGWAAATSAADARLLNTKPVATPGAASSLPRPRLVKTIKPAAQPVAAPQPTVN